MNTILRYAAKLLNSINKKYKKNNHFIITTDFD